MAIIELLSLMTVCTALIGAAGFAIVVLPWTEQEMDESELAWRTLAALPSLAKSQLHTALSSVQGVRHSRL